ncbi:GNAT family N-acetyltransferase [Pseudoroseomonas globiformis]|uniref:GNAT family N-acetyltransferase n=1 Tax=Teichococcus globiformis TaxID=2307229 RepID=A0ABV7G169_9PROT
MSEITIEQLSADALPDFLPGLSAMLVACVAQGASIGFLPPLAVEAAEAFWRGLVPGLADGSRRMLVARQQGRLVGTGALLPATLPNGRHRAEISKLMVHPAARRQGIGAALMSALETMAAREGRWLLVLDTLDGDAGQAMYRSLGWQDAGIVPDYALVPQDNGAEGATATAATRFMFKRLPR